MIMIPFCPGCYCYSDYTEKKFHGCTRDCCDAKYSGVSHTFPVVETSWFTWLNSDHMCMRLSELVSHDPFLECANVKIFSEFDEHVNGQPVNELELL